MIKQTLALFIVLLAACGGVMTPEERGIVVSDRIGVFNQSKVLFTTQLAVEDHYGVDLGDMHTDAVVYWTDTICPKNGLSMVIYRGECNYGRMWSLEEVYVAVSNKDPEKTCGSALVHEFGHALHFELFGSYNGSHDHDAFWDVLKEPNRIACERGW